jgi:hypothetical protein
MTFGGEEVLPVRPEDSTDRPYFCVSFWGSRVGDRADSRSRAPPRSLCSRRGLQSFEPDLNSGRPTSGRRYGCFRPNPSGCHPQRIPKRRERRWSVGLGRPYLVRCKIIIATARYGSVPARANAGPTGRDLATTPPAARSSVLWLLRAGDFPFALRPWRAPYRYCRGML